MTMEERGLYITLLCLNWSQGSFTEDQAKRLAMNGTAIAQPSFSYVLSKFEKGTDEGYRNARLETVRANQESFRENRSESGKKGALKRWGNKKNNSTAIAQPSHSHSTAIAQPMAKNSSPSPVSNNTPIVPKGDELLKGPTSKDLEMIYAAYPRKEGKPVALRAIEKKCKKFGAEFVLTKTQEFAAICDKPKQFIPNPSTFFNQERFNDNPETWKHHEDNQRNNTGSVNRAKGTANANVVNDYAGR